MLDFANLRRESEFEFRTIAISPQASDLVLDEPVIKLRPILTCHAGNMYALVITRLGPMSKLQYSRGGPSFLRTRTLRRARIVAAAIAGTVTQINSTLHDAMMFF